MKENYIGYYEQYSLCAIRRFKWDSFFARTATQRDGLLNRRNDYPALQGNDNLRELHLELNRQLLSQSIDWSSHGYGEGYFSLKKYQCT